MQHDVVKYFNEFKNHIKVGQILKFQNVNYIYCGSSLVLEGENGEIFTMTFNLSSFNWIRKVKIIYNSIKNEFHYHNEQDDQEQLMISTKDTFINIFTGATEISTV